MNFQGDIQSIPNDSFKDHFVLVFHLTSMQDATENSHYPELVGELLRLELNITYPLEHVTELKVLGEWLFLVSLKKFGVVGKKTKMDDVSPQQPINRIPLLNYQHLGSFFSDYVSIFPSYWDYCH